MTFLLIPNLLPKDDQRYIRWKESLKKRPAPWNKGKTKDTHKSVQRISQTFKNKKIDNFKVWRERMLNLGIIQLPVQYLKKSYELAVLTGLILGDGHINKFPRTERLTITLNTKYPDLITLTSKLTEKIFIKKPTIVYVKNVNCARVSLYQKNISSRLGIITGNRSQDIIGVPEWIWEDEQYIIGCLKGLFEAEGSLSIHLPTYTYNFQFANKSNKLLSDVKNGLITLGFHPEVRPNSIRLRRKEEVKKFRTLISFRKF